MYLFSLHTLSPIGGIAHCLKDGRSRFHEVTVTLCKTCHCDLLTHWRECSMTNANAVLTADKTHVDTTVRQGKLRQGSVPQSQR